VKRYCLVVLAIAVCLLAWRSAVETTQEEYEGKTVIRWVTDGNPVRADQIAEFERLNPDVHVVWDYGRRNIEKAMIQISGRRGPDLIDLYDRQQFDQFAAQGAALDITPFIEEDNKRVIKRNAELVRQNREILASRSITEDLPADNPLPEGDSLTPLFEYNKKAVELNRRYFNLSPEPEKLRLLVYPITKDLFFDAQLPQLMYQGRFYATPTNVAGAHIVYNKDVFDRWGVAYPSPDWDMNEFFEKAKQLSVRDPRTGIYLTFAMIPPWPDAFVLAAGGDYFTPNMKRSAADMYESRQGLKAAGILYQKQEDGQRLCPTKADSLVGAASTERYFAMQMFGTGNVGMCLGDRWILSFTGPSIHYGYAPFPRFPGELRDRYRCRVAGRTTIISRDCRHPDAAFKFLKYLCSREYGKILHTGGDAYSGVRYYEIEDWATFDPSFPEVQSRMCARIKQRALAEGKPNPLRGKSPAELADMAAREWRSLSAEERERHETEIRAELTMLYQQLKFGKPPPYTPYVPMSYITTKFAVIEERVEMGVLAPQNWAREVHKLFTNLLDEALDPTAGQRKHRYGNIIGTCVCVGAVGAGIVTWTRRRKRGTRAVRVRPLSSVRESLAAACFLAPNLTGFLVFTSFPVVYSLVIAFSNLNTFTNTMEFVGFNNFSDLLTNRDFWYYFSNTLVFLLGLPLTMVCALLLAMVLNNKLRGFVLFRTIFYLPSVVSGIAIFLLWKWIYNTDWGLLNQALRQIGFADPPGWLTGAFEVTNPATGERVGLFYWAKPALIVMMTWMSMGGPTMLLFLAGLTSIPPELYEAADIDGTGAWRRFRYITWPLLAPTTFFIFIMGVIAGLQGGFEMAYVMTEGGPQESTTTIGYYIYSTAFFEFRMGAAAAAAWFLFIMVFGCTLLTWRFGERRIQYV
jgi:multiple sugar transport system permease protein